MYQGQFVASDDADWAVAVALFDNTTNEPLEDAADASFDLEVSDRGTAVLTASTDAGTIQKPESHIVQWWFTRSQMQGLCPGRTYKVGLNMTTNAGTTCLLIGSLALLDGGVDG